MAIASASDPANGTVVLTGGSPGAHTGLTYQPDPNYCNSQPGGDAGHVHVHAQRRLDSGTVSVTVTCADDLPTAVDDAATVPEDSAATPVAVLANDNDPDGDATTIASASDPAHGTVVLTGGLPGARTGLTYEPEPNYCNSQAGGAPDTFTYTLNGGVSATVSVTVTCGDDAPTAVDDTATVGEDSAAGAIAVLANDTDTDGGAMTIASASDPANGTVVLTGRLGGRAHGPDLPAGCRTSAARRRTRSRTRSTAARPATVSVTVTCVDDPPTAVDDSATVGEDSAASAIDVLANDTDTDGGPTSVASVTQPANGTVVITGGGSGLTYQPAPNYCGADSFTYTLNGGDSANVSVTVTCVDDAPMAVNDSKTVAEDAAATDGRRAGERHRRRRRFEVGVGGDAVDERHGGDHRWRHGADVSAERRLLQRPARDRARHVHVHAQRRLDGDGVGHGHVQRRRADGGGRQRHGGRGLRCQRDRRARQRHGHGRRTEVGGVGDAAGERHGRDHRRRERADVSAERELLQRRRRTRSRTRSTAATRPPSRSR